MKNFIYMLFASLVFVAGCSDSDDAVTPPATPEDPDPETEVNYTPVIEGLNNSIATLREAVGKATAGTELKAVEEVTNGMRFSFVDGTTFTALFPKTGNTDDSPAIGVRMKGDTYYWTLNGEWLLDDNVERIPTDKVIPRVDVADDAWQVSYNNGKSWIKVGKAYEKGKDSVFEGVDAGDKEVRLILRDQSVLTFRHPDKTPDPQPDPEQISAVKFRSKEEDGTAVILKKQGEAYGHGAWTFAVEPKTILAELLSNWQKAFTIHVIYGGSEEQFSLSIEQCTADAAEGQFTLAVSGETLSDAFYAGSVTAFATLTASDGKTSVTTDRFTLKAIVEQEQKPDPEPMPEDKFELKPGVHFAKGVTQESGWYDVNKKGDGRTEYGDAVMCWAAASSNLMEWWQDRYEATGHTLPAEALRGAGKEYELRMFEEAFVKQWINNLGSQAEYGIIWYMSGEMVGANDQGSAQPRPNTGGYLKSIWSEILAHFGSRQEVCQSINGYYIWGSGYDGTEDHVDIFRDHIAKAIHEGAAAMTIRAGSGNIHAITLWGYELDEQLRLVRIFVTDSDDRLETPKELHHPALLNVHEIGLHAGYPCLKNAYGGDMDILEIIPLKSF